MYFDGKIPKNGPGYKEILEKMDTIKGEDLDWYHGRTFSLVYHLSDDHHHFLQNSYGKFISENFLNPMAFKSLKKMESEVVRMTANMLNGDDRVAGTMTSGGTESILMAIKSYRERAKKYKPWIIKPEIVVPETIHVAFEKACHYFGVKMVTIPVDNDFRADLKMLKKKVNRNTIMIGASAPQYVQGVVDPIEEMGQFALKKKIPLHIDACIGGFMLPWLEKLGQNIPLWDFRVPGVTSISADVHKYGYASKGASVVVYRDMSYLKHQFFVSTNWPGGIYASPNMPGTRPGGAIAAAWGVMKALGENGYMDIARETWQARQRFVEGILSIPELEIMGEPHMTLLSFRSRNKKVDIYAIADQMDKLGWSLDRHQRPPALHATITSNHAAYLDKFFEDLKQSVEFVKANPELGSEGKAAMYGMMAKIPMRGMVKASVVKIMEGMWGPNGEVPDLENVGASEDDDKFMQLVNKYGPKALDILKKVEDGPATLKNKVRGKFGK